MTRVFESRARAGELLAELMADFSLPEPAVVAVNDGGLPVAEPIARRLGVPCGLWRVADLVLPWRPALAFGAITDDNHHFLDAEIVADHSLGAREVAQIARETLRSLRRTPRPDRPELRKRQVVIVADALATGYRALAVVSAARAAESAEAIVVSPCAARDAAERVEKHVKLVVAEVSSAPRFDGDAFFATPREPAPDEPGA